MIILPIMRLSGSIRPGAIGLRCLLCGHTRARARGLAGIVPRAVFDVKYCGGPSSMKKVKKILYIDVPRP